MTRTVLRGGVVFDGSGAGLASADVVIEDGRIVDVGVDLDGDEAVDCRGRAVLPGFFDCHVHVTISTLDLLKAANTPFSYRFFKAAENLQTTLACGITTARDAAGADLGIQQAVDDGLIPGPRLRIALNMVSQTGGHNDPWMVSGTCIPLLSSHPGVPPAIVDSPDQMRRVVRELVRAGANWIKVATSGGVLSPRDDPRHAHFRDDELEVLVAEARAAHIDAMAHAHATDGIKAAVRAGIRSIEHGTILDDEAIDMMLEAGTYLVPTLVAPISVVEAAERGQVIDEAILRKGNDLIEVHQESFRRAVAAGVRIAMGTDSGVGPHGDNLRELSLMRKGGMSPADVLVATTRTSAELLGLSDELGTLEPGKRADLVVVDGDPLELTTLRERVAEVWKDGVRVCSWEHSL